MNLHEVLTRMTLMQLLMTALTLTAVLIILTTALNRFLKRKETKPTSFIKERNRFKAEIAEVKTRSELKDALYSFCVVLAIFVVLVLTVHGK